MIRAPYTFLKETRDVPVVVYFNGKQVSTTLWSTDYFVEKTEDWHGLNSSDMQNKYIRVITREEFFKSPMLCFDF